MQVVSSTGSTTLTAAITSTTATAISVAASQNLAAGVVIQIGSELLQVTAVTGLNLTVTRGFNGTTAATATNGATVNIMAGIAIGTLLNATTAAAYASLAIDFNQIRIDGTVLSSSSSTACTTDAWGTAWLYTTLTAGPHRIEVQATGALPWAEPCFYVGPVGQTALTNAGLNLQVAGNVVSGISATQFTSNLPYATFNHTTAEGQVLTFTSGALNGQSYNVQSAGSAGSPAMVRFTVDPGWATNPSAGDAFTLSNVATANAMYSQIGTLPVLDQIIDPTNGDGSAIITNAGVPALPATPPTGYGGGSGLTQQQVRDAMALATSATIAAGSVDVALKSLLALENQQVSGATLSGITIYGGGTAVPEQSLTPGVFGGYLGYAGNYAPPWSPGQTFVVFINGYWWIFLCTVGELSDPSTFGAFRSAGGETAPWLVQTWTAAGSIFAANGGGGTPVVAATVGNPLAVIAALINAGVLQYVSGSSGPLEFTTAALANIPAAVNVETVEEIGRC